MTTPCPFKWASSALCMASLSLSIVECECRNTHRIGTEGPDIEHGHETRRVRPSTHLVRLSSVDMYAPRESSRPFVHPSKEQNHVDGKWPTPIDAVMANTYDVMPICIQF